MHDRWLKAPAQGGMLKGVFYLAPIAFCRCLFGSAGCWAREKFGLVGKPSDPLWPVIILFPRRLVARHAVKTTAKSAARRLPLSDGEQPAKVREASIESNRYTSWSNQFLLPVRLMVVCVSGARMTLQVAFTARLFDAKCAH